jgi:CAAX prenyl protease-like protein
MFHGNFSLGGVGPTLNHSPPMQFVRQKLANSPETARVLPFAVFVLLTAGQGKFGPYSVYWVYLLKTLVGAWLVWTVHPLVQEMRWRVSWEAIVVGVVICVAWIGLDGLYPALSKPGMSWVPNKDFGTGSALGWFFNTVHIVGYSTVVPAVEEIFYRSFMYRYLVRLNFLTMPLNQFHSLSFVVTSILFGLEHPDRWVAGILCGMAYQWLTLRKNRLGDAMTAHAITNFLLGVWVLWKGAWSFW